MKTVSLSSISIRHCPACAYVFQPNDSMHPSSCPSCLRPLDDRSVHRLHRLLGFIFGLLTQLLVGLFAWYFPPGTSAASWALYFALGLFGFVQIIWGARGWKHARHHSERPAVTAEFEPDDIPFHAKQCRSCGHNLAATIAKGARRCPSCQTHFSLRDLGWRAVDPRGEPVNYAPHEMRLKGPVMVAIIIGVFLIILLAFWGMGVGQHSTTPLSPPSNAPAATP